MISSTVSREFNASHLLEAHAQPVYPKRVLHTATYAAVPSLRLDHCCAHCHDLWIASLRHPPRFLGNDPTITISARRSPPIGVLTKLRDFEEFSSAVGVHLRRAIPDCGDDLVI